MKLEQPKKCKNCGRETKLYLFSDKPYIFSNRRIVVACSEECANEISILSTYTGSDAITFAST